MDYTTVPCQYHGQLPIKKGLEYSMSDHGLFLTTYFLYHLCDKENLDLIDAVDSADVAFGSCTPEFGSVFPTLYEPVRLSGRLSYIVDMWNSYNLQTHFPAAKEKSRAFLEGHDHVLCVHHHVHFGCYVYGR